MTAHPDVDRWIADMREYTGAASVRICDGSKEESAHFTRTMLNDGSLIELNQKTHPGCYVHRPKGSDVARATKRTFMVGEPDDVGPTNNPMSESRFNGEVWPLFQNSMKGKTMLAVPYMVGPLGSPATEFGIQLTDAPLVPKCVRTLYNMGPMALAQIRAGQPYLRGLHAVADVDPDKLYVCHVVSKNLVTTINSASAGGNIMHPKKAMLRMGSRRARNNGYLTEHMALFGIEHKGKMHWFVAALPSSCGKTTLATMLGVVTIGDDLVSIFVGPDGRFHAITRERGGYGVAKGTNMESNPTIMKLLDEDVIFMGTAITPDGQPWWVDCGKPLPEGSTAWDGRPVSQLAADEPASHPNARFTVPFDRLENISKELDNPMGVPLSGIIFGGRSAKDKPLVYRTRNWQHLVYTGATMESESTAASTGPVGVPGFDSMAMGPFGGYHLGDYFGHWLGMGRRVNAPPMGFHVNWFRTDDNGKFLWDGFKANRRVLEWMAECVEGTARQEESILGYVPAPGAIDIHGLKVTEEDMARLHAQDPKRLLAALQRSEKYLKDIAGEGDKVPAGVWREHDLLRQRIQLALAA